MQKWLLTIIIAILPVITACSKTDTEVSVPEEETGKKTEIKFLQLNLWVECTKVEHAPEYLIEQIAALQPDIATFCELYKGPQDDPVMPKLMQGLKEKGLIYYDARIDGRAVISKYPIKETERINKWMFKAILDVNGKRVAVYPAHSEYRYYTCYYPRGYNDGSVNWDKLPAPITDVNKILAVCEESDRIESAQAFINNAAKELEQGALYAPKGNDAKLYGTGTDLNQLVTAGAELTYNVPHWKFGLEYTLSSAWYGSLNTSNGKIQDTHAVCNNRIVAVAMFMF